MASRIVRQESSDPPTVRAAIYARVSTLNGNQDPTMQTRELEEYCQRRGWQIHDIYVDNGVSGKKDSRPQLNRMMQDAHERRLAVVVVWRFDRFARSVSHLLRALETFNALGVQFVSLSEQVDTSTPMGKMVFTVLGAVGELERNLIVERVRAGLRHARAKGKRLGRPRKSVDAVKVRSLRAAGESWRTIARKLDISVGTAFAAAQGRQEITSTYLAAGVSAVRKTPAVPS
jgi:DNA invertase Pin-like site-specific DNA recombinase